MYTNVYNLFICGLFFPRLPISELSSIFFQFRKWIFFLIQTQENLDKQRRKHYLDLTVMKHKADALDARTVVRQTLLADNFWQIHPIAWSTDGKKTKQEKAHPNVSLLVHTLSLTSTQLFIPAAAA